MSDPTLSPWRRSWRADPAGAALADKHYNRQKVGAKQFVPPGRCVVFVEPLRPPMAREAAVWVTSWPFAEHVKHRWAGAWVNSLFRNIGPSLSSELIRAAVAATRAIWPDVPDLGLITFVDPSKVRSARPGRAGRCRGPGYCYLQAGFRHVGETKEEGHLAFQLLPADMPEPMPAHPARRVRRDQLDLFTRSAA